MFRYISPRMARSAFLRLLILAALLPLGACADNEPERRGAFINVLRQNVLEQSGGRIALLTEADKKAIGPYAEHFAVLADTVASDRINVTDAVNEIRRLADEMRRTTDPAGRLERLERLEAALASVRRDVETAIAEAQAKRAALKHPQDLKAVYDQAYEKLIGNRSKAAVEIFDLSADLIGAFRAVNDYVSANPDKVHYGGDNDIIITDGSAETQVTALLAEQNARLQKVLQALHQPVE